MPIHGLVGLAVTALGIVQPLNAIIRPHGDGFFRTLWELIHKSLGRVATLLGLGNCILGALIARQQHENGTQLMTGGPFNSYLLFSLAMSGVFVLCYVMGKCWVRRSLAKASETVALDAANHIDAPTVIRPIER